MSTFISSLPTFAVDCDQALVNHVPHAFVRLAEAGLRTHTLGTADLAAAISSPIPIAPTEGLDDVPKSHALIEAFAALLSRGLSSETWSQIKVDLKVLVETVGSLNRQSEETQARTAATGFEFRDFALNLQGVQLYAAKWFKTLDGRILLAYSANGNSKSLLVVFAPLESAEPIADIQLPLARQRLEIRWHYSPTQGLLAAVELAGTLRVYSPLVSQTPLFETSDAKLGGEVWQAGPNGEAYLTVFKENALKVYRPLQSQDPIWSARATTETQTVRRGTVTPDGRLFLEVNNQRLTKPRLYEVGGPAHPVWPPPRSPKLKDVRDSDIAMHITSSGRAVLAYLTNMRIQIFALERNFPRLQDIRFASMSGLQQKLQWLRLNGRDFLELQRQDRELYLYEPIVTSDLIWNYAVEITQSIHSREWRTLPGGDIVLAFEVSGSRRRRSSFFRPLQQRAPVWQSDIADGSDRGVSIHPSVDGREVLLASADEFQTEFFDPVTSTAPFARWPQGPTRPPQPSTRSMISIEVEPGRRLFTRWSATNGALVTELRQKQ